MARRFLPFACTPLFRFLWKIDRFFRHLVHPISLFFFPNCYYLATISNYPYEKRCRSRTNESIIMIIRIKENGSKDTAFERRWRTAKSKETERKKDRSGGKNMGIGGQDISEGPVPRTWWSSSPPPPPRRRLQNGKKRGRTKTVARRNDAAAGIPRNDICSPLFRVLCHEGTTAPPFARGSPLLSSSRSRNCDRYRVVRPLTFEIKRRRGTTSSSSSSFDEDESLDFSRCRRRRRRRSRRTTKNSLAICVARGTIIRQSKTACRRESVQWRDMVHDIISDVIARRARIKPEQINGASKRDENTRFSRLVIYHPFCIIRTRRWIR